MSLIFLIGFMGSGKSTIGRKLAKTLKYKFMDLDEVIEKNEAATISEIFSSKGENYFRERESHYLKTLVPGNNIVVATGGGTPCFYDNMEWMNEHGITVYLKTNPGILFSRLKKGKDHRPLLSGKSDEEFKTFVDEKLKERETYYNRSRIIVNQSNSMWTELQNLVRAELSK